MAAQIHLHDLLAWLRLHPAGFRVVFPERRVNNVYFDTPAYDGFVENLFGSSARTKVRYRWYGDSRIPGPGALEVKQRRNYFGWKHRYEIDTPPLAPGEDGRALHLALRKSLPPAGRLCLEAHAVPVLANDYRRRYFESHGGEIRVTVDTGLVTRDLRFVPDAASASSARDAGTVVVEFKFDRARRALASEILRGFPLRVGRHSKYVSGLRALAGI